MKREELECPVVDEYYGECEWESHQNKYYYKEEADAVMDAMEKQIRILENDKEEMYDANLVLQARIKELEVIPHTDNSAVIEALQNCIKELEAQLENVQNTMATENVDANMSLVKANERINELVEENKALHQANIDCNAHFNTLKEDYDDLKTENDELTQTKNAYKTKYIALQNENKELKKKLNQ